ncbi:MAG: DUF2497 domain-containing protein [Pseudomonadota bacterium]
MARQDQEPSVEDILASIKKVMAADSGKPAKPRTPRKTSDDSVLELTDPVDGDTTPSGEDMDDPLVDAQASQSIHESLAALTTLSGPGRAPQIVRSGETSLEGLVREMLRPMLKQWLDDNLPELVEQMVAKEIARITSKRS